MNLFEKVKKFFPRGSGRRYLILLVIVLGIPVAVFLVRRIATYIPQAQVATVSLTSSPATGSLPPNLTVRVNLNAGASRVGFVRFVLNFNPAHINLAGEISTTARLRQSREPATDPWIIKTSMAEANSTGRVVVVLALDELDRSNPPSGTFEVASFPIRVVATGQNLTTQLTFNVTDSQVVDMDAQALNISTSGSTFTLNPVTSSPTPTSTPTRMPTPTPTPSPIRTPTPTLTPTPTRLPTPTPTRVNTPTPTSSGTITTTPTPTPICIDGDANCDGSVNILDYSIFFASFGKGPGDPGYDPRANLNHSPDGLVNILDYSVLFYNFGNRRP